MPFCIQYCTPNFLFVAQSPQVGYITPSISSSNSTSSLYYPDSVHSTPFVPSPTVPSPPRSETSAGDGHPRKPAVAQNKARQQWQASVSTSASGSSICTCFLSHPFDLELYFSLSHTIHRWAGTITFAILSRRTPLPLLHPTTSRSHLLRHSVYTLRTHSPSIASPSQQ